MKGTRRGTHLAQGQHHEGSPTTGVHNHGHKFGVNGAEVAVPRHLGDSDVIVALVGLGGLAKDVAELAVPNETPGHGGLGKSEKSRMRSANRVFHLFQACKKNRAELQGSSVLLPKLSVWL